MANEWKCPRCGGVNPAKKDVCMGCRTPRSQVAGATPAPVASSSPSLTGDWKCPKCGGINPAKRDTCIACATPRNLDEVAFHALKKDRAGLLTILTGENKGKRMAAVKEIIKLEDDPTVHAALLKGVDDSDAEVRQAFAVGYLLYQYTNRDGYNNIRTALDCLSPVGKADFTVELEKTYGPNAMEWWEAIAGEFDARKSGQPALVEISTPTWGSGGKIATAAAITLLTGGNANAGVGIAGTKKILLNEHIKVPAVCHVCGIRPYTHEVLIEKSVMSSIVGTVIAGSSLGDLNLQMKVPLCARCAALNRKAIVSILRYGKVEGQGKLVLSLYNAKIAEKYAELNQGRMLPTELVTPQVPAGAAVDLSGQAAETSTLRLRYTGGTFLVDARIDVYFDGRPAGVGTAKTGLDLTIKAAPGKHTVLVVLGGARKKEYLLDLASASAYEGLLSYSRNWGNFSKDLSLRKLPSS